MKSIVTASIQDITAFVAVAQSGSFTRAAEDIGSNKSNVGKAVQRLEAHLATRLLQRTTRAVHLTEDGETYLKAALIALEGLREAEEALASRRAEPVGRVRVDLPAGFGRLLMPSLGEFRRQFPKVVLELSLTDRMSDPLGEGWDIIVRIGELPIDSELTVRKLCELKLGLYASPDYLAARGQIDDIADLTGHDAIIFRGPANRLRPWSLQDGATVREMAPDPTLILADGQALLEASILGLGVAQILDRVAQPHVQAGRLVHLLPGADVPGPPVHAIIPLGQKMTGKIRVVLNYLVEQLRNVEK